MTPTQRRGVLDRVPEDAPVSSWRAIPAAPDDEPPMTFGHRPDRPGPSTAQRQDEQASTRRPVRAPGKWPGHGGLRGRPAHPPTRCASTAERLRSGGRQGVNVMLLTVTNEFRQRCHGVCEAGDVAIRWLNRYCSVIEAGMGDHRPGFTGQASDLISRGICERVLRPV